MLSLLESFKKFFTYNHSSPVTPVIKEKDKMIEITKTYLEGLSDTKVMASGPGDNVKLFTIPSHIVLKDIDETLCVENTQTKQCLECYLSSFTVCDEVCSNKLILESISKGEFENVVVEPVVEVAEPLVEPLVESLVEPLVEPVVEQLVEHVVEVAKPEDIIENLVHEILFDIPKVELPFEKYVPFPPYDSECPTPDCTDDLTVNKDYAFIDSESPGPAETSEFD